MLSLCCNKYLFSVCCNKHVSFSVFTSTLNKFSQLKVKMRFKTLTEVFSITTTYFQSIFKPKKNISEGFTSKKHEKKHLQQRCGLLSELQLYCNNKNFSQDGYEFIGSWYQRTFGFTKVCCLIVSLVYFINKAVFCSTVIQF